MLVLAVHPPTRPPVRSAAEKRAAGGGGAGAGGGGAADGGGDGQRPPLALADVAAHPGVVRAFRNSRPLYPVYGYFQVGPSSEPDA